jgi:hypothetical protein
VGIKQWSKCFVWNFFWTGPFEHYSKQSGRCYLCNKFGSFFNNNNFSETRNYKRGVVAHAYNPNYSGGSWENHNLRPAPGWVGKVSRTPSQQISRAWWHVPAIPAIWDINRRIKVWAIQEKTPTPHLKSHLSSRAPLAHTYKPSYSGDRDQEDQASPGK